MPEINWIAVVVAAVACFLLGGLWYSKALFGKAWQRETGLTDEILEDVAIGRANATGPPPPGPVARHYDRFQKLWNAADNEDDTIAFIQKRIRELG